MITPTREQVVPDPSIRDAFERRFKEPPFEFSLEQYGEQDAWPGNYKKFSEQCAWDGYQEARADLEATIAEQSAEIATLQSKADALAELLIKSTIDEWQPGFTNREYDSDEPKENEFRELVLSALAAYKESKQ